MDWEVITKGLSPVGMMNGLNDDQVVTLSWQVKLSFASAPFLGDLIVFKPASLFLESLMQFRYILRRLREPGWSTGILDIFVYILKTYLESLCGLSVGF